MKTFKPFVIFCLATLATLSLSRILLLAWKYQRVADTDGIAFILLQGVRFDLVLLGIVLVLPLAIAPLASTTRYIRPLWNPVLRLYLVLCFAAILFVELATPSFIDQYDLRPNYLFFDYLKYPREVFSTLWAAYRLPLISAISITAGAGLLLNRWFRRAQRHDASLGWWQALALTPLLLILCVGMARSTLDHRPVNPSTVAFSPDPLVNTLALSSAYNLLYALADTLREDTVNSVYGSMPPQRVSELVARNSCIAADDFVDAANSTLHGQTAYVHPPKPYNLVIILEESLGADFVGALGGKALTPHLDALARDGIWFENMFATGTRSVRGIEAVITGFPPTPMRSVVKLAKSQTGFFTIARLLARKGYDTSFIYGGEAHFDNMKRFMANNGFDTIIDEKDYENPRFYGSWGVSDEDLFARADEYFRSHADDQPFFSLVFTSSNHSPFEFPDNRIPLQGTAKNTVDNAVRYADYALGAFIEKAHKSSYWKNTVFVIVADHSDKVFGSEPVPVKRFHIPALILGGPIEPARYRPVASQIDLLPTSLSLIGIDSQHPAIGCDLAQDIARPNAAHHGRAIMQFGGSMAYMKDDRVVILSKGKAAREYRYVDQALRPAHQQDRALEQEALAHAIWSIDTYQQRRYALPGKPSRTHGPSPG